jgi:ribosome-binding factor A
MSLRIEKVNDLLRDQLSKWINRELSLKPGVLASITRVKTSADLSQSSILVRTFPSSEADYALATLEKEKPLLRKKLARELKMRKVPKLKFVHDQSGKEVSELEEIFQQISAESSNQSSDPDLTS